MMNQLHGATMLSISALDTIRF